MENEKAAEQYFAAFERWDLEAVASFLDNEAVEGRPQSGERFVGRENHPRHAPEPAEPAPDHLAEHPRGPARVGG